MVHRISIAFCVLISLTAYGDAQVAFRQGSSDSALPAFGGYVPGSGVLGTTATRGRTTFRQGSFGTAIPAFGGYLPGSGALATTASRRGTTFRQGSFGTAIPAFGGYVPGSGARLNFGNAVRQRNRQQTAMRRRGPVRANQRPMPVAPTRRPQARAAVDRNAGRRAGVRQKAAEQLLHKGERAEAAGNLVAAEKYYRAGLKRDADKVNEDLRQRLARISGDSTRLQKKGGG